MKLTCGIAIRKAEKVIPFASTVSEQYAAVYE